jgi:hypothetical protein
MRRPARSLPDREKSSAGSSTPAACSKAGSAPLGLSHVLSVHYLAGFEAVFAAAVRVAREFASDEPRHRERNLEPDRCGRQMVQ